MKKQQEKEEGILIFTNVSILLHKQEDGLKSENEYCFWATNKLPMRFCYIHADKAEGTWGPSLEKNESFRLYFAVQGKVRGYFVVHDVWRGDEKKYWLIFYSESWCEIKDGEQLKPSQGWRYYPKKGGL